MPIRVNKIPEDEDMESVLDQMKEDYAMGKISLKLFEELVHNRLRGRTPVDSEGMPLYYEYGMLNNTGRYYL